MQKKKQKKSLAGKVWPGFKGECNSRNPCYLIPEPNEDGIFICDILKSFINEKVRITIEKI